jgi:HlyD family secretion protein
MINIKKIFISAKNFILKHKIISAIAIIILATAGFFWYKNSGSEDGETRYILSAVSKETIITSVSGTGQVSSSDQKDIKPKASGEIIYLNVKTGQSVTKGALLAKIDTTTAEKAIQTAEENLETAQINLEKLKGPEGTEVPRNKQEAIDDLEKSYEDGYNSVSTVFLDLPNIIVGLNDILYGYTFNNYQQNIEYYTYSVYGYDEKIIIYKESAKNSYQIAKDAYNACFENYKLTNRYSDDQTIDSIINETYQATKNIAQAVKDVNNLIQVYKDILTDKNIPTSSTADTHLSNLNSYLSKTNSALSTLFSAINTIKNNIETVSDADLDLRSQELLVEQKERALQEAKDALNDYYIYAPLSGIISELNISTGEDVSSGTSLATIITDSKIAQITLSEVDVAKVKIGNRATLTFDAIEDLTLTGEVTEVDSVGSANSGVVSYGLEITFDTNEENIKSGMSASATIITNSKGDVLTIPTAALKTQSDGTYYVQILSKEYDLSDKTNMIKGVISDTEPQIKIVEIGLSDDTNTEITSGLSEGDQVVVRVSSGTISATSNSSSSTKSSGSSILNTGSSIRIQGGGPPGM